MRILSFDVGIKNLAYCILEYPNIIHWEVITLENSTDHAKLYVDLINSLDSRKDILLNVDTVLIEKQPSFNPKMRIIAGCLQTYFFIRGIVDSEKKIKVIKFYSPKNKLKCYDSKEPLEISEGGNKYSQTKKAGVVICEKLLLQTNENWISFFKGNKKRDDLADSYLQGLTYHLQLNKMLSNIPLIITQKKRITKKMLKESLGSIPNLNLDIINKDYSSSIAELFNLSIPLSKESLGVVLSKLQLKKKLGYLINE
jgi:hypothetical protein